VRPTNRLTRRQFLKASIGSAFVVFSRIFQKTNISQESDVSSIPIPDSLFQHHIGRIPHIAPENWSLWIYCTGDFPKIVTYSDMLARNSVILSCTLLCAGNPPGGNLIGSGEWRGVLLYELLNSAELSDSKRYVRFDCADGYSTSIELKRLKNAILAYSMNGQRLAIEHGFPLRLVVPGLYGYKMPKWIQRISVLEQVHTGFWESRGWLQDGVVKAVSEMG
jgi:DMSO/TMAO reductase YedYZ molybdopterin-dependent catalytic subunit